MDFLLAETENNISLFNNYALVVTSAAILVTMILALIRAMLGPTVFDRVLALNMFGTKTVLLICVIGFLTDRTDFLDLALLYSLMNFIGMVALLRFSEYGSFREEGADIGSSVKS
ncbi:MAG: monovalent cation/H+ antiporter complex subunit F [Mariniblastus sp.]